MNTVPKKWLWILAVAVAVQAVITPARAEDKIAQSAWAGSPPALDGSSADWQDATPSQVKKVSAEVAFRNDSDYLYVLFRFKDPSFLSSIDFTGMTLWIDPLGKKKKDWGFRFTTKKISAEDYIALLEEKRGAVDEAEKTRIRASAFYFLSDASPVGKMTKGWDQERMAETAKGAAFNAGAEQKTMVYEFRLPLARVMDRVFGRAVEPGEKLGVGFEWGGLTDEMRNAFLKGQGVEAGGRMGISEGGRGTGGASSAGFSGASPQGLSALRKRSKKHSLWMNVFLAGE